MSAHSSQPNTIFYFDTSNTSNTRAPDFRVVHLTDIHVMPDGAMGMQAQTGLALALEQVQNLPHKPDLILQGGDAIMDALNQDETAVAAQWHAFGQTLEQHLHTPIRHTIGNHDCWTGPGNQNHPKAGKIWAMQAYQLERPYYSFDAGGWHFIVLDSTSLEPENKNPHGYTAKLDETQFQWLEADLQATPSTRPVLILSHIPILAACTFLDGDNEAIRDWIVPGAWMHLDARRVIKLFAQHNNVKLCLSGHIHLQDTVIYNGVTYACNGAVCGSWWNGNYHETPAGYAIVDLWEDASFRIQYLPFDS